MIRIAITTLALLAAAPAIAQTAAAAEPNAGARFAARKTAMCVADGSPKKSAEVLMMDVDSPQYRSAIKALLAANRYCFGKRGKTRDSNLLFLGALAESMLAQGSAGPLNVRLARAAGGPPMGTYGPADRIIACAVRSAPDEVAGVLATELASKDEKAAAEKLGMVLSACARGGQPLSINVEGLRAALAAASYRSIHAGAAPVAGN